MNKGRCVQQDGENKGCLISFNLEEIKQTIIGLPKFKIKRFFTVAEVAPGTKRGGHAHKENSQVLICLSGNISVVTTDYIKYQKNSHILTAGCWLYHPPLQWIDLLFLTEGSVLLSLCSHLYDPDDYIKDQNEWLEYIKKSDF